MRKHCQLINVDVDRCRCIVSVCTSFSVKSCMYRSQRLFCLARKKDLQNTGKMEIGASPLLGKHEVKSANEG